MSVFQKVLEDLEDGELFESVTHGGKDMVTMNAEYFQAICDRIDRDEKDIATYEERLGYLGAEVSVLYHIISQAEDDYDIELYTPSESGRLKKNQVRDFMDQHEDVYGKQGTSH